MSESYTPEFAEVSENRDFIELARDHAERFGATTEGFGHLRQELLERSGPNERNKNNLDPQLTRLTVNLYNEGLKAAGIEDSFELYYHYTSKEGRDGIQKDGAIKVAGGTPFEQVRNAYSKGNSLIDALRAFAHADNWEGAAVHVTDIPPNKVSANQTDSVRGLAGEIFGGLTGRYHGIGVSERELRFYYEIVTTKSEHLFRSTFQDIATSPIIDEKKCVLDELKIGDNGRYLVLGPRENERFSQKEEKVVEARGTV